jgi:8-hydroxy-5-deazaflavin:NADPH oxidoreductase
MNVGIFGTGNLAIALGRAWATAGADIWITGRDSARAGAVAAKIGGPTRAIDPAEIATAVDALVLAVSWEGLEDALALLGGPDGSLAGKTVIDPTNPVDFETGRLALPSGSAAELIAGSAPGAQVVKALHLFAGTSWPYVGPAESRPVVAICGDDRAALELTASLVDRLGAETAILGGIDAARQLEDAAGFVMRVVVAGQNPRRAVPDVEPSA